MPDEPLPGEAILDKPVPAPEPAPPGEPGTHPAAEPAAEPQPTPPTPGDEPPKGTEDDEPEEWRYLADRFHKLRDDPQAFKREIGKTYLEKTRFATEAKERADAAEAEAARLRAERDAAPKTPPPPHPDVERLEARITALSSRDESFYKAQENVLVAIAQCNEQLAVAKYQTGEADEENRAYFEDRTARLQDRKGDLQERFKDYQTQRELLSFNLEDAQNQRQWTAELADEQGQRESKERTDRERFDEDFPQEVARGIEQVAEGLKITEAERGAMRDFVIPRLTVQFWKLGQAENLEKVDVGTLIETEVRRWHKSQDSRSREAFRTESEKRLAAQPPASPPAPTPATPPGVPQPPSPSGVKEVTALGLQDVSPTMLRGRSHLATKGL